MVWEKTYSKQCGFTPNMWFPVDFPVTHAGLRPGHVISRSSSRQLETTALPLDRYGWCDLAQAEKLSSFRVSRIDLRSSFCLFMWFKENSGLSLQIHWLFQSLVENDPVPLDIISNTSFDSGAQVLISNWGLPYWHQAASTKHHACSPMPRQGRKRHLAIYLEDVVLVCTATHKKKAFHLCTLLASRHVWRGQNTYPLVI